MLVKRGYRVELDLNNEQITACRQHVGASRWAYNWGLARIQQAYKAGQRMPSAIDLHRELNALKQTEYPWMYAVSKCAAQEALRDLENAFKHFFRKVVLKKQGQWKGKCGYPRFKSKKRGLGSCRFTGSIYLSGKTIHLPRLGILRLEEQEYLPVGAKVGSATLSEQAGRWFVSVCVQAEQAEPTQATGSVIGVDLGIKQLATVSDGRVFENPKALRSNLKRLRRLSRRHSRKVKGSKNRKKAQRKLARQHARIANIRRDALHKVTSALVAKTKPENERPACIVLEDLNVSGMLKNKTLSRAIADVGMFEFRRQIEYKARAAGIRVQYVSRWYPSSKTCSSCGTVRSELTLSERAFVCFECGYVADRDENAARVLAQAAS